MRIISGAAGGVPIRVPKGEVRPTSDRVREALFSILGDLVSGARCLDLYAGSGALGLEALSRGASSCMFVDRSRAACEAVRTNLAKAGLEGGEVRQSEVDAYLRSTRARYDLVFADPPYSKPGGSDLAEGLALAPDLVDVLEPGGTLLLESRKGAGEYRADERLEGIGLREYGDTQLLFFRRREA